MEPDVFELVNAIVKTSSTSAIILFIIIFNSITIIFNSCLFVIIQRR